MWVYLSPPDLSVPGNECPLFNLGPDLFESPVTTKRTTGSMDVLDVKTGFQPGVQCRKIKCKIVSRWQEVSSCTFSPTWVSLKVGIGLRYNFGRRGDLKSGNKTRDKRLGLRVKNHLTGSSPHETNWVFLRDLKFRTLKIKTGMIFWDPTIRLTRWGRGPEEYGPLEILYESKIVPTTVSINLTCKYPISLQRCPPFYPLRTSSFK